MQVNWLKNKFIDAMAEKREEVQIEEENELNNLDQLVFDIRNNTK